MAHRRGEKMSRVHPLQDSPGEDLVGEAEGLLLPSTCPLKVTSVCPALAVASNQDDLRAAEQVRQG